MINIIINGFLIILLCCASKLTKKFVTFVFFLLFFLNEFQFIASIPDDALYYHTKIPISF